MLKKLSRNCSIKRLFNKFWGNIFFFHVNNEFVVENQTKSISHEKKKKRFHQICLTMFCLNDFIDNFWELSLFNIATLMVLIGAEFYSRFLSHREVFNTCRRESSFVENLQRKTFLNLSYMIRYWNDEGMYFQGQTVTRINTMLRSPFTI